MALIKCPECSSEVSDKAESCPKCAYPIAGGSTTQPHSGKIRTIELTSKKYKRQQLLAILFIIGSFIIWGFILPSSDHLSLAGVILPVVGSIVGLTWLIAVRFMIWWHHG